MGAELEEWLKRPRPHGPGMLGRAFAALPPTFSQRARDGLTTLQHRAAERKLKQLVAACPRLHLGCGFNRIEGWVNIDRLGSRADVYWNLRHRLPLADESVDAIFHEHMLEHLPLAAGLDFTRQCRRLLRTGGVLRVVVPDAGRIMELYAQRAPELVESAPTHMLGAQPTLNGFGHVSMYDADTLHLLMQTAGFSRVETVGFGEGQISPVPDSPSRRTESVYVEATA